MDFLRCSIYGSFAVLLGLLAAGCVQMEFAGSEVPLDAATIDEMTPVWELLIRLGEEPPEHWVKAGRDLVFEGHAVHPESVVSGPKISGYYRCIECHSTRPEQSDPLQVSSPEAKLAYAILHDLPLVQGASFAGLVNHEQWFNDAYAEKYRFSAVIDAARSQLKKAIEMCSRECSKGRDPEPWEVDAMLAYFWSLEWRLGDVGYTGSDLADLRRRVVSSAEHPDIAKEIQSRYSHANPATFGEVPSDLKAGYPMDRPTDLQSGREIWSRSCLHCHGGVGSALRFVKDDPLTWQSLDARFDIQIYHYIREGTRYGKEKRPYMPNYTK